MERGTVKRRIFISNALMVLTTLLIFLIINMTVVKIYSESIETELKTSLEQMVGQKDTDQKEENQDGIICIIALLLISQLFTRNLEKISWNLSHFWKKARSGSGIMI